MTQSDRVTAWVFYIIVAVMVCVSWWAVWSLCKYLVHPILMGG
jgi:hypothetical protein